MPRTKSKAPTLEQRCPPNGEWTFRRLVNGKRKTFYTGTSDYQEALAFRDRSIASETIGAELITRKRQNAIKVIRNLSEVVDGLEIPRLTFQEGFDYWLKRNPEQLDNSLRRQKHIRSNYAHFKAWCEQKKLRYMDEISNDISVDYALHLWNSTHIRGPRSIKKSTCYRTSFVVSQSITSCRTETLFIPTSSGASRNQMVPNQPTCPWSPICWMR